jgi:hypothetical protein
MDGMSPVGAALSVIESTPSPRIRSRSGRGVVRARARERSSSIDSSNSSRTSESPGRAVQGETMVLNAPMHDARIGSSGIGSATSVHIPPAGRSLESEGLCRALLYAVSHDVWTPLTAIRTITAALRSADLDTGQRDALLVDVDREAERLARLLSNLLDAARVEADALRPALVRVPVEELCRAAVDDARASLGGRLVEIELERDLPPVEVDETMIRRALVNVLENAARHDPGPLRVRAARAGGYLETRVIDHGPGVPTSERQRIFDAFQRLPVRRDGTGLGLTIARGFVEAHRGDVRVETTKGGGATFVLSLPIGQAGCASTSRTGSDDSRGQRCRRGRWG